MDACTSFVNKNYLIIGGSSGIGLAVAQGLVESGANAIIVGSSKAKLRAAKETLATNCSAIVADLSTPGAIEGVFKALEETKCVLDGMVYCAGISPLCLVADNSQELMQKVFQINVFSYIEAVRLFQDKRFSRKGSRIVAISSITAKGAGYRQTLYGSSKAAMISATKLMARELYNREIRINCISPGVTDTPMLDELRTQSDNLEAKVKEKQMLGIIPPQNIGKAVIFLLSDGSDFLSGTEWVLDGGDSLK